MESLLVVTAVLVAAFVALAYASRRAITICELLAKDGELAVVRGRLPPRVLGDLRDVARRDRLESARIFVVRSKDRARVEVRGTVNTDTLQRIRNVIGTVPLAKLLAKG